MFPALSFNAEKRIRSNWNSSSLSQKVDYSHSGLLEVLTPRLWNLPGTGQLFCVQFLDLGVATSQSTLAKVHLLDLGKIIAVVFN
jgi:hypothetical protein